MARTVAGQVTWADPDKGMKCIACAHCGRHPSPPKDGPKKHQCSLVFVHTQKKGVPFDANSAIACSMFSM
jgi:hypothetical protein